MVCQYGAVKSNKLTIPCSGGGITMVFECQQCGECCHHMGQVHTIEKTCGEFEFLVNNQYTGEKTKVIVDSDKHDLFEDTCIFLDQPEACPFLRYHSRDKKAYCTVHQTRPEICRDYGCWRLLILNSSGKRAGRIMYQRAFYSDDAELTRLWNECIDHMVEPDDVVWDKKITRILISAGYTVKK
jgi:Fe-S-cluster containining protein